MQPASAAAALAADGQRRWAGMTTSVALLSMALGVVWHTIVALLMGGLAGPVLSWFMLAGLPAGLAAGSFTVWSRKRRQGRESIVLGLATYYLAVTVYSVASSAIGITVYLRGAELSAIPTVLIGRLFYAFFYGTILGVVLIPFCFLTRHLLWQFHVRMLPNKPQQATRRAGRNRSSRAADRAPRA